MSGILIVDDEAPIRRLLGMVLAEDGHEVIEASSLAEARVVLDRVDVKLVVTDQRLGDGDGLQVLAAVRELAPTAPVVFLTAFATVDLAVEAMRAGAFDVIPKPFDPEATKAAVARALDHARLVTENQSLRAQVHRGDPFGELIGESPAMRKVKELIGRVAPTAATVLVTGETGVGKELVARAVHAQSPRAAGLFVALNCAAVPEGLLESELFGHEKGAFTGADRARPGLFEAANAGTLFLDEAGEMSLAAQAKLLRVLSDGLVVRVGSHVPRKVDVRLVVATHQDLPTLVGEGAFREDLFFRLAVFPLHVPPLRERMEDLPMLVGHFLAPRGSGRGRGLSAQAFEQLAAYRFPGNVRELRNILERACILAAGDVIEPEHLLLPGSVDAGTGALSRWVRSLPGSVDLPDLVAQVERALIEQAMLAAGGVQAEAARRLGISRSDLHYKLSRRG
ncbi:MAG TPA: sigma-54 dependent transcriptional regulator [Anaeromyxobacteraceae bacterium]|nr:sigma-54 dependent transcriptional regulator [Anaeromyxobacteraceae bacterium]